MKEDCCFGEKSIRCEWTIDKNEAVYFNRGLEKPLQNL